MEENRLGSFIRRKRYERGYSSTEMANRLGISNNWYSQIELGKNKPSIQLMKKIAKKLGVKYKDLYDLLEK